VEIGKLQQPISSEKMTSTIQKCAREHQKREQPRLIRARRKAERTNKRTPKTLLLTKNLRRKHDERRNRRKHLHMKSGKKSGKYPEKENYIKSKDSSKAMET
jgi:hypothetical protein